MVFVKLYDYGVIVSILMWCPWAVSMRGDRYVLRHMWSKGTYFEVRGMWTGSNTSLPPKRHGCPIYLWNPRLLSLQGCCEGEACGMGRQIKPASATVCCLLTPPCPHSGIWYQFSFPRSLQSPCVWDAVSAGLRWDSHHFLSTNFPLWLWPRESCAMGPSPGGPS